MAHTRSLLVPLLLLLVVVLGTGEMAAIPQTSTHRTILFPDKPVRLPDFPTYIPERVVHPPCRDRDCYVPDGHGDCKLDKFCAWGARREEDKEKDPADHEAAF